MQFTQDTRSRPMLWLVCAACVSVISFWFPDIFSYSPFSNQEYVPREVAAMRVVCFPIAMLSVVAGFCFYVLLWRRTRRQPDAVSRRFFAVGSVLFMVAISPLPLFVALCAIQDLFY